MRCSRVDRGDDPGRCSLDDENKILKQRQKSTMNKNKTVMLWTSHTYIILWYRVQVLVNRSRLQDVEVARGQYYI